ncbi:response regulator transcription factor [Luteimonas sp. S4-F44]|uniref:response regulator transcription factor n=1 Tax=Luteimonas sp. S4-F44 TaxID=2925842 RepID=UPI001F534E4B|nr:response regulator transcription factor [Luteimonas sp. S4-F44]UNK43495.1 response regulator transcription factor [Luteimonas sp. S4-F44]
MTLTIALLEDDDMLRERILLPRLADFGFLIDGMASAAELELRLLRGVPDIVVLDVGLPDASGYDVARSLRMRHPRMGIVMLTARRDTPDRVRGLNEGADAYLAKPVEIDLLAATLHSLARRLHGDAPSPVATDGWRLADNGWRLIGPSGHGAALTKSERRMLQCLVDAEGETVARDRLIAAVSDNVHDFDPHRLDTLIYRLRRKVAEACGDVLPLSAVHGEGYVLTSLR